MNPPKVAFQEFKNRTKHKTIAEVAADLKIEVEEKSEFFQKERFTAKGGFFDEIDMRKRYEGKPEQLANVLRDGRKFFCHIRGVQLIQDPAYSAFLRTLQNPPHNPPKKAPPKQAEDPPKRHPPNKQKITSKKRTCAPQV